MKQFKEWLLTKLGGKSAIIYVVDKERKVVTRHWINSQLNDTTYRINLDRYTSLDFTTNTHKITWRGNKTNP